MLENDINFSRDESGNYVALVKVLNPAYYGGTDPNINQNMAAAKQDQNKKDIKKNANEIKKEEMKLKEEKGKSSHNSSKSMPKNASEKYAGENKGLKSEGLGFYEKDNSVASKKKNAHKSSDKFEKEKKSVSQTKFKIFFYYL